MSPSTDLREHREFASEIKFLVAPALAEQIRAWARARLAPDPNASGESNDTYRISSLYFDTERFDVYHRKGSFGRSKFRARRYDSNEVVFLERKLKTRGLLAKRRSIIDPDELQRLADAEPDRDWVGGWFHNRLLARRLRPVCQISYNRTARVAMTNYGPIRLTLDDGIRVLQAGGLLFNNSGDGTVLSEQNIILELKYRFEMPALFKLLTEEFALNPHPVSKYRLAVVALGFVPEPGLNGHPKTAPGTL